MDDIIVYGITKDERDERMAQVLEMIRAAGLKLNESKCLLGQTELTYLGPHIDEHGEEYVTLGADSHWSGILLGLGLEQAHGLHADTRPVRLSKLRTNRGGLGFTRTPPTGCFKRPPALPDSSSEDEQDKELGAIRALIARLEALEEERAAPRGDDGGVGPSGVPVQIQRVSRAAMRAKLMQGFADRLAALEANALPSPSPRGHHPRLEAAQRNLTGEGLDQIPMATIFLPS
ncbi:uncharacterized protein LOC128344030 [Hemicordylus capensis]|uniref:uncharacterized protein LOC128344030 n=1 Tax=Hemicordylus capensis TaxID=884348 RepID=UPI00230478AB|nr:uncharacterized protein LOC128344030 [Hemicordylus capensis]